MLLGMTFKVYCVLVQGAPFSIHSHLSHPLIASCHQKKIQCCFIYVNSGILSDPCELNVNWSGKIQQLMMCSTAEEEHTFCLISSLVPPAILVWFFLVSFLYPVCHEEEISWHTRFNSDSHYRIDHTVCIKDKLWIRTASEGSCNRG